jgi:L-idonate 5-dehydrogenase
LPHARTVSPDHIAEHGLFDIVLADCFRAAEWHYILRLSQYVPGTHHCAGCSVAGSLNLPINAIVGRSIFKGTHRFHPEFKQAVDLIGVVGIAPV